MTDMTMPYFQDESVTLHHGDCLDVLTADPLGYDYRLGYGPPVIPDSSVDAVVTDPPYLLGFMGKQWDTRASCEHLDWHRAWVDQCLRVLKPGGYLLAFGGSRTWHRLASAVEDAGFEIRDSIAWLYGSGFPKSLDVSKAIDKAAGAEREKVRHPSAATAFSSKAGNHRPWMDEAARLGYREVSGVAPVTDAARTWQGWGTALKPAFEPIVVGRKPLAGTVAGNVLQHGTGALNIDGCRIGVTGGGTVCSLRDVDGKCIGHTNGGRSTSGETFHGPDTSGGRWPTNVVLDDSQAAELDGQTGNLKSGWRDTDTAGNQQGATDLGKRAAVREYTFGQYGDEGGASRFFPTFRYEAKAPANQRPRGEDGTAHPTVKPLDLMRWLVRLVTPPGGLVLEPFAGSGTTVEACLLEGMRCIAIEREATYLPLIVQRISKPLQSGFDFTEAAL